jgi:His/Glu/Gln/Arg/opine family amino acid ABC transporter permease subunit
VPQVDTFGEWVGFLVSRGLVGTIQLAAIASVTTVLLAGALAIARISPVRALRIIARVDVDLFRSIPLLALLIFFFFGLGPLLAGFGVNAFWLAVAALTFTESAYLGEVYRGALESIPASQWEAARSLGMNWRRIVRLVVIPQAVLPAIPATVNLLIAVIKDSALASLIAVGELTLSATILTSLTFKPVEVYLVVGLIYLAVIVPLSLLANYSERIVERRVGLRMATVSLLAAPEIALPLPAGPERVPPEVDHR